MQVPGAGRCTRHLGRDGRLPPGGRLGLALRSVAGSGMRLARFILSWLINNNALMSATAS